VPGIPPEAWRREQFGGDLMVYACTCGRVRGQHHLASMVKNAEAEEKRFVVYWLRLVSSFSIPFLDKVENYFMVTLSHLPAITGAFRQKIFLTKMIVPILYMIDRNISIENNIDFHHVLFFLNFFHEHLGGNFFL
jgi:hypothetical protein